MYIKFNHSLVTVVRTQFDYRVANKTHLLS